MTEEARDIIKAVETKPAEFANHQMHTLAEKLLDSFGEKGVYAAFTRIFGYTSKPPEISEFIDHEDWLGDLIGRDLYLPWRHALYEIYPNPFQSPFNEIIATGAIGTGKTTLGIIGSLYDLVKFTYLENPQRQFGLLGTTKIAYAILNVTLGLAGNVVMDQLHQMMEGAPRIRTMMAKTEKTMLPKNIDIFCGSRASHALGMAIVGAILDEVNFQNKVGNQAMDNYNAVKARIESRFLMPGGSFPGRVWLLSSKKNETDFLEQHLLKNINNPSTKIYNYPIWEIQKHKPNVNYCGKTFKVFVGDQNRDPMIVDGINNTYLPEERIIDVPTEYQERFNYDLVTALRDLAGMSVGSIFKFIGSIEMIHKALRLPNPVMKPIIELDFWNRDDKLIDYMFLERLVIPQYRFAPRHIHIDMGLKHDRLGIASTFIADFASHTRFDPLSNQTITISEPQYVTEFVIALEAKASTEIPIYKVKEFLFTLQREKYPLTKVTMDGFQSSNLLQDLNLLGINAEYLSCDKTKDSYAMLKDAILQSRWLGPIHEVLLREIKDLVDVGKKIDHPAGGSKDLSDAVSGSMLSAYRTYLQYPSIYSHSSTTTGRLSSDGNNSLMIGG